MGENNKHHFAVEVVFSPNLSIDRDVVREVRTRFDGDWVLLRFVDPIPSLPRESLLASGRVLVSQRVWHFSKDQAAGIEAGRTQGYTVVEDETSIGRSWYRIRGAEQNDIKPGDSGSGVFVRVFGEWRLVGIVASRVGGKGAFLIPIAGIAKKLHGFGSRTVSERPPCILRGSRWWPVYLSVMLGLFYSVFGGGGTQLRMTSQRVLAEFFKGSHSVRDRMLLLHIDEVEKPAPEEFLEVLERVRDGSPRVVGLDVEYKLLNHDGIQERLIDVLGSENLTGKVVVRIRDDRNLDDELPPGIRSLVGYGAMKVTETGGRLRLISSPAKTGLMASFPRVVEKYFKVEDDLCKNRAPNGELQWNRIYDGFSAFPHSAFLQNANERQPPSVFDGKVVIITSLSYGSEAADFLCSAVATRLDCGRPYVVRMSSSGEKVCRSVFLTFLLVVSVLARIVRPNALDQWPLKVVVVALMIGCFISWFSLAAVFYGRAALSFNWLLLCVEGVVLSLLVFFLIVISNSWQKRSLG